MKKILSFCATLFLCASASHAAAGITVDTYLLNGNTAVNSTYSIRTDALNWGSMQVVVTSMSPNADTFTGGNTSTGSFTVASFAALSSATATGSMSITSNSGMTGICVSGGGGTGSGSFNVCEGRDFNADVGGSTGTACNLARAINSYNVVLATCGTPGSAVVYTSAPVYGLIWNSFDLASSSYGALSVPNVISSTTFQVGYSSMNGVGLGHLKNGQDNATVRVNGVTLTANRDFYPLTSNGVTATNLATGITNSSTTSGVIAGAGGSVVYATSTAVGTNTAYALFTSTNGALSLSPPAVVDSAGNTATGQLMGGTNSAYTLNSAVINLSNHGYTTGLQVGLSTGSAVALNPLTTGTSYYVMNINANNFALATSLANAVAGSSITITSSSTLVTAPSFTLRPVLIGGTATLKPVVSNDGVFWTPLITTPLGQTVTVGSYGTYFASGNVTWSDLGHIDSGWLGVQVVAPTSGAINAQVRVVGKEN